MTKSRKGHSEPFLKWVGGKRNLLDEIRKLYPRELTTGQIKRYIEPFVGGGAVLFDIVGHYEIQDLFIWDKNPDVVLAYKAVQKNVEKLIEYLKALECEYVPLDQATRKKFFSEFCTQFNATRHTYDYTVVDDRAIERASQILFINRAGFNGLWRVNKQGEINIPCGRFSKNYRICLEERLHVASVALQNVNIQHGDYSDCLGLVDDRTLLYLDPPYLPISETSSFSGYTAEGIANLQHNHLAEFCRAIDKKGGYFILSNSIKTDKTDPLMKKFFDAINVTYSGFDTLVVQARRNVNSHGDKRGKVPELIVTNCTRIAKKPDVI